MSIQMDFEPQIRITYDDMEAYLYLPVPEEGSSYTTEEIFALLEEKGVRAGILRDTVTEMVEKRIYLKEIKVAEGKHVVEGQEGYYEYHFQRQLTGKPQIKTDGSVDYWNLHLIESVVEGQVIAEYHPAVQGQDGYNVKGNPEIVKPARELQPLRGKGFTKSEDGLTYTSNLNGKIEMQGERINISPVNELFGNADLSTGNIDFHGDIVIHGNVINGIKIKATGTVTIDGVVEEGAEIIAGKDVVLRSGMMGGGKASVVSKGNIFAKFFEYTRVEARGCIEADVFLNSEIICGEKVILEGHKGSIIGGSVRAVQGLDVQNIGNRAEVETDICVGVDEEIFRRKGLLEKKIEATEESLRKVEEHLAKFEQIERERGMSSSDMPRKMQMLREKIKEEATMAADQAEMKAINTTIGNAKNAIVNVYHKIYPGVSITIDNIHISVKDEQRSVSFIKRMEKVVMEKIE